jgi:hypothetical protein
MTFFSSSLASGLLAVLHGVLDLNFKLCAFVVNGLIKGEIEKPSDQFLGLIVMSHWLGEVWIRIWDIFVVLQLSLFHLQNHVYLSHGVQVAGAACRATMRIVAWVGDLVQRTGDSRTGWILDDRMIERSGDAVCSLHRAHVDEKHGFLDWASKLRATVCEWFGLKTTRMVFSGLASKPVATIFSSLTLKLMGRVFQFGRQNRQL